MPLNTQENREAFVKRFGCKHPKGPWSVDLVTADIILGKFDTMPKAMRDPRRLYSFIMQNRTTYMLGESYMYDSQSNRKKITDAEYYEISEKVTSEIYDFVKNIQSV